TSGSNELLSILHRK
nr:Chain C, mRNA decapping protein 2 [Saccharomyces cerevisiae]5LMG_D Chain D, mRNA decapping protein 2 [Saccharomyces cerevisiae]